MTPWIRAFAAASACLVILLVALVGAMPARAQQGSSTIQGRVTDAESGAPIEGATVTVTGSAREGAPPTPPTQTTDADGVYSFSSLVEGSYGVRVAKDGYTAADKSDVVVRKGSASRTDVAIAALPAEPAPVAETPAPAATGGGAAPPPDVEEFIVLAPPGGEILAASRIDSDELLNTLSAAEISKFAASDVASALKFVAGVNVVEGQFAVIRGLEDRYSSTLFNGAVVPSPDPDSQSVQLDLFPSDIVTNLVVAKSFAPDLPGNSAGGSIDIITLEYPEDFVLKFSAGSGGNPQAFHRFLEFERDSATGIETDGWDVAKSEFGASFGGSTELLDRGIRFRGVINREIKFDTAVGTREGREPTTVRRVQGQPTNTGDLSLGELSLSSGLFDLTESERSEQQTGYGSFGIDLDEDGNHKIDFSGFYTKKDDEVVELRENGYFRGFDYSPLVEEQLAGSPFNRQLLAPVSTIGSWIAKGREEQDAPMRGPLWYSSFFESRSFETDRKLRIYQLNGDHTIAQIEGLRITWAANDAKTTQDEAARGLRYYYEPDDLTIVPTSFPVSPEALGEGIYAATSGFRFSNNSIEEKQRFGRVDGEYEIPFEVPVLDEVVFTLSAGGWYEKADRTVEAAFLDGNPRVPGSGQIFVQADNPEELGSSAFEDLILDRFGRPQFTRDTTSDASRKITAWDVGGKATFWDQLDFLGGIRREKIEIESRNDPFTGSVTFTGAPAIFPSAYLFFDRLDNPGNNEGSVPPGLVYNDQILGISVPVDPVTGFVDFPTRESLEGIVNGLIDETKMLPAAGFAYRPIEGLSLRGAFSRTVARPSFRELGYYATVAPGSDDVTVGNPQLGVSDVESFDLRAEYTWGGFGDLAAVSLFTKKIQDPIESIVVRDASNGEFDDSGLFRTFFNNPNEAHLRGFELELRKNLGDFGPWGNFGLPFLEYFSIGGNYSYIDAEVDRTEPELERANQLFGVLPGEYARFGKYAESRRLYNQPEWIANADVSFDNPDWGTRVTVSFYAISSVLDAAGVASVDRLGTPRSFTLDRYVGRYYQVDVIASQRIWRGLDLKFSLKNLTNSTRTIIYDQEQTKDKIEERKYELGQDYSISLSYTFEF